MRQFLFTAAALAGTATAQSATALTFWRPGPANNPSMYSKYGLGTTTYPPVASIVSSDAATTIFSLGCPSSIPASLSSIPNGDYFETCSWSTEIATYTIINSTRHVMHQTGTENQFSAWWTCDYNTAATQVTCALEVSGDVNDNTGGPVDGIVYPDKLGNVVAFATASVVTEGQFAELDCGIGDRSSARECKSDGTGGKASASSSESATKLATASGSAPAVTATQGSGVHSSMATRTASGSVATASAGVAAEFGIDSNALAALFGVAAFAAW